MGVELLCTSALLNVSQGFGIAVGHEPLYCIKGVLSDYWLLQEDFAQQSGMYNGVYQFNCRTGLGFELRALDIWTCDFHVVGIFPGFVL
jgi:hypothetical protein